MLTLQDALPTPELPDETEGLFKTQPSRQGSVAPGPTSTRLISRKREHTRDVLSGWEEVGIYPGKTRSCKQRRAAAPGLPPGVQSG